MERGAMGKTDVRLYRLSERDMVEAETCMKSVFSEALELLRSGSSESFASIRREAHDSAFSMIRALHLDSRNVALFSFDRGKPYFVEYEDRRKVYFTCERLSETEYRFTRTSRDYDWLVEAYRIRYSSGSPFTDSREYSVELSITDVHSNTVDVLLEKNFTITGKDVGGSLDIL
ncbi:MAG: hypothetical protein QW194_04620 [Candidatus Micrarchaeaceae archaeon]